MTLPDPHLAAALTHFTAANKGTAELVARIAADNYIGTPGDSDIESLVGDIRLQLAAGVDSYTRHTTGGTR